MKKELKWKRLLAHMLVVILVIQMALPMNVLAMESVSQDEVASELSETEAPITDDSIMATDDFVIVDGFLEKYNGNDKEVNVPEEVIYISENAFSGNKTIEKVVLPESVVGIGSNAFASCTNLKSINLPEGLKEIGEGAFSGCTDLTIDCITLPQALTKLETDAFAGVNVGEVRIEGDLPSKDKNGNTCNYAGLAGINASTCTLTYNAVETTSNNGFIQSFFSQGKDKTVVLDFEGADSVNQTRLLNWVMGWYEDTDPDSVKISNMEIKHAPDNAYYFKDGMLFSGTTLLWIGGFLRGEARIPENVTLGQFAFYSAKDVKVYLPDSMTNINGVMRETNHPVTIVLPDTLEHLERVTLWINNWIRGALTVVLPKSMDNVTFGSSTTSNGVTRDVFSEVDTIVIPAAMQKVPDKVLYSAYDLNAIVVESGNTVYKSVDGALYSADGKILYRWPNVKTDGTITIPEGVEEIASEAIFVNKSAANISISFPASLKKINKNIFANYYTTTKVDLFANKCANNVVLDGAFTSKVNKLYVKNENSNWAKKVPYSELIVGNASVKANVLVKNEDGSTSPCPKGGYSVWVYDANGNIVSDMCAVNADGTVEFFIPQNGTYTLQFNPAMTDGNVYKPFVTEAYELVLGKQITIADVVFERIPVIKVQTTETNVIGYVYDANGKFVCDMSLRDSNLVSEGLEQGTYTVILHKGSDALMKQNRLSDYEELGLKEGKHYAKISGVTIKDKDVSYGAQNVPAVTESGLLMTEKCSYITSGMQNPNAGYVNLEIIYAADASKLNGADAELAVTLPENVKYVAGSARFVKGTESMACSAQEGNASVTFAVGNNTEGVVRFAVKVNGEVDGVSVACLNSAAGKEIIGSVEFSMNTLTMRASEYTATASVNVTGEAPKGKEVSVYIGDVLLGKTTANAAGIWSLDVTLPNPVANEKYVLNARVQTASEVVFAHEDVIYLPKAPQVKQIKYHYPQCGGNGYFNVDMNTMRGERVLLTYVSGKVYNFTCDFYLENSENVTELYVTYKDGRVKKAVACQKMDNNGMWRLQIPVGVNGFAPNLKLVAVTNVSGAATEMLLADFIIEWIIDPSGYVYEAVPENKVEGATVTIYYKDGDKAVKWDADPYAQQNPLVTDAEGFYAWNVPTGEWKVVVEKEGYQTVESAWLPVPPVQLDVNLELVSKEEAHVTAVELSKGSMLVSFDKYMNTDSVTASLFAVTNGKNNAAMKSVEAVNPATRNGKQIAKQYLVTFASELTEEGGAYNVSIAKGAVTYAGVAMSSDTRLEGIALSGVIEQIEVADVLVTQVGQVFAYKVTVSPKEAAAGRALTVVSSDESTAKVVELREINKRGEGVVFIEGVASGSCIFTIGVEGSALTKQVEVYSAEDEKALEDFIGNNEDIPEPDVYDATDISDAVVTGVEDKIFIGMAVTQDVKVVVEETELVKDTDYTVSYENNVNAASKDAKNPPVVIITGMGDYEGSIEVPFSILPKTLESAKLTLAKDKYAVNEYTVEEIAAGLAPEVTVIDGETALVVEKDFTVTYKNNRKVGTAMAVVTGLGNYEGTLEAEFEIEGINLAKVTFEKIPTQYLITGVCEPVPVQTEKSVKSEGKASFITYYDKNDQKGTATIYLYGGEGTNTYGSKKITFKIAAVKLTKDNLVVGTFLGRNDKVVPGIAPQDYTGEALKPTVYVAVKYGEELIALEEGKDYTLSYGNNVKASKLDKEGNPVASAKVTVKGKGNFTGSAARTFVINPIAIGNGETLSDYIAMDVLNIIKYTGKNAKPAPKLYYMANDKKVTLKAGKDYKIVCEQKGEKDKTVKVEYTINGIGNFKGSAKATVWVTDEKVSMKLTKKSAVYTGGEITLAEDEIKVFRGKTEVDKAHYSVKYLNNVNAGTATVIIKGDEKNFIGEAVATFKITPKTMKEADDEIIVKMAETKTFTGNPVELGVQELEVFDSKAGKYMVNTNDFTLKYSSNTKIGTAKVTLTGKGDYKGKIQKTFKITKLKDFAQSKMMTGVMPCTFNGKAQKPELMVYYYENGVLNGMPVELNVSKVFTVTYKENKDPGTGTAILKPKKGIFETVTDETVEIKFNIGKANIDDAKANVIKVQPYKGKAVTPKVSLKLGSYKLKEGVDYTVEYENNDSRGRATIIMKAIEKNGEKEGYFTGEKKIQFFIF